MQRPAELTFGALDTYAHHAHSQPPFLDPNVETLQRETGLFFSTVSGLHGRSVHGVLGALAGGHLGLQHGDESVVFGELGLQMMA